MPRYRKKPVEIEAIQYQGGLDSGHAVFKWAIKHGVRPNIQVHNDYIKIKTLEGTMRADPGDWIIRGVKGEVYPCKPDVFEQTYEAVKA